MTTPPTTGACAEAKDAAEKIQRKIDRVNPEWCMTFAEIIQRAITAATARLEAQLAEARKDGERLEAVRMAALHEISYDAEPASEKYVTGTIQMAHRILATGQPDGVLKSEPRNIAIDQAMKETK